ncbi:hypothetical protein [Streptomyces sp. NRRL WC-3742]|uniref:hypothetical protein n=1 Tax=Streptomyces sp. NRRL WC-3742 TaxID=1463934 RepID=UPI0004C657F0|nr:hypothetical protein [Streptomyces sp. NRRL WC-3742]
MQIVGEVPVGEAPKCIGDTFATVEATLALATIAAQWRLEHPPGRPALRPLLGASLGAGRLPRRATPRRG